MMKDADRHREHQKTPGEAPGGSSRSQEDNRQDQDSSTENAGINNKDQGKKAMSARTGSKRTIIKKKYHGRRI